MAATSSEQPTTQPLLAAVEYLQKYGAGRLQSDFNITSKQHSKYPNLWLFKYHQSRSDFNEQVVRECRGLIVDSAKQWRVVAYPYYKFFNFGEEQAAEIDWSTAKVYDKVDGSLATLYWYKGEWNISSSGVPDASGSMDGKMTFAEIFWELWGKTKYKLPTDTSKCYMFEMFARKQRIVVPVNAEMIFLHGVRDLQTLQEVDPVPIAEKQGYKLPPSFPLRSLEEVIEAAKTLTPDVSEGFVVVDAHFNRIKIKSPIYVAVAHLNTKDPSNLNYRSMLSIIRANESQEFLTYFPDWKALYNNANKNYRCLLADISNLWDACKDAGDHESQSFGLAATKFLATKDWPNKDVYFNIVKRLQGGLYPSVLSFMQECDIKILLVLVERFGVRVLHAPTTKIKTLKDVQKKLSSQKGGKQSSILDKVQGPPKEPVFDMPSLSPASSSSASSSSASSSLGSKQSTASSDVINSVQLPTSGKRGGKKSSAASSSSQAAPKVSKAEARRMAEEEEMRAFLAKLEQNSK